MQQVFEFAGNHPMLSIGWLALLAAVIYSFIQPKFSKVKSINNHEATMLMNKQDAVVVDIRTKDEYRKGAIAGSRHIPLTQIQSKQLSAIEKFKSRPIIVVCDSGMRSSGAAKLLLDAGFESVFSLRGGVAEWKSANLPLNKVK